MAGIGHGSSAIQSGLKSRILSEGEKGGKQAESRLRRSPPEVLHAFDGFNAQRIQTLLQRFRG